MSLEFNAPSSFSWLCPAFAPQCVRAQSLQLCLTLCELLDWAHKVPLSMGFSRQEYWSGLPCPPLKRDLPNPGIEPRSSALHVDSLPSEPPGKPKNTGVGTLSLLQGIFPTQGSNPGLLHCTQTLYHLSHLGSSK